MSRRIRKEIKQEILAKAKSGEKVKDFIKIVWNIEIKD